MWYYHPALELNVLSKRLFAFILKGEYNRTRPSQLSLLANWKDNSELYVLLSFAKRTHLFVYAEAGDFLYRSRILGCNREKSLKGTVRPDWICMRVVSLKSPLKGHQPLYVLNFLFFYLEFLKQLQSSEPLHAKRPLILLLVRFTVCMCSNRDLFRQTVFHKWGRGINCSLDCGSQVKNFIIPQPEPK